MKKFLIILSLILTTTLTSAYRKPDVPVIDAVKNANNHNNMGINYMSEKVYYAAIQEFKIAISLNPESQTSAIYYNNLGECYMKMGLYDLALDCFERALTLYNLNLRYYINLAQCFIANKLLDKKLEQFSDFSNPYNRLMSGILYVESGDYQNGITILDAFTIAEPDLIITPAVKSYIKASVKKMNAPKEAETKPAETQPPTI